MHLVRPLSLGLPSLTSFPCRKSDKKQDKGKAPEKALAKTPSKTPAKPSEQAPAHNGPKKWDQNQMGEGQFFGQSIGNRTVVNGSIRSFNMSQSRPGTASSSRVSPYTHNTHALAASSMYDLSNVSHIRQTSSNSLKPAASETNLRTNFNNASMTNLKVPGPGFSSRPGSRPGTPGGGKPKAWVNPLDVHFGRTTPSAVPSAPRSPLAQYEIGANDGARSPLSQYEIGSNDGDDNGSVFGDKAENIADTIMSSVAQKEQEQADRERAEQGKVEREREEREARQKAQDEEKKREEERQKEQEKHRAAAAATAAAIRAPHHGPPGHPPPNATTRSANGPHDRPIFQGRHDQRPSSRNGHNDSPGPHDRPVFRGQDDHHRPGSRNGSRPRQPHGQGPMHHGPFQGQMDYRPSSRNGQHDQRPRFQGHVDQRPGSRGGPHDRPHFQGHADQRPGSRSGPQDRPVFQGQIDQRPGSRGGPRRDGTPPYGHPNGHPNGHMNGRPMNGQGPMRGPGPMNGQPRSPSFAPNGPMNGHGISPRGSPFNGPMGSPNGGPRAPAANGPPRHGSPRNGSPMNGPSRPSPNPNPNNPPSVQRDYFPADLPSPTTSTPRSSGGAEKPPSPEFGDRPVIRDVVARRDTITSIMPKRASVSMAIDAFEKSLVDAAAQPASPVEDISVRDSTASSAYSVDEIIDLPVQQQQPVPPAPFAAPQPQRTGSGTGRPFPGKGVQRPNPEEYGVVPTGRMTPATTSSQTQSPPAARLDSSSPPALASSSPPVQRLEHASLQPAPLFRQPKWNNREEDEDFRHDDFSAQPRPVPGPRQPTSESAANLDTGATPPTPDPTNPNWPLAPAAATASPPPPAVSFSLPSSLSSTTAAAAAAAAPPQLQRPNPPPPLSFNFSPDAFSRDHGPLTPPAVTTLGRHSPLHDALRPSTANGEIGMARGPSVRRPDHGLQTPTGIADRFGTPLI